MIRLSLFAIFITYFSLRSFKDWFTSLCVLFFLTAILEHPDVPKNIAGIQGLNPWNLLFLFVFMGWIANKKNEIQRAGLPPMFKFLFFTYLSLCIISYVRMASDTGQLVEWSQIIGSSPPSTIGLFAEHFVNTLKWVFPGILVFYGCNSVKRVKFAIAGILSFGFVLALLTIKAMPLGALTTGDQLQYLAIKLLSSNVGYHRVNIAMLMAGFFWAVFSCREILEKKYHKYIYLACFIIFYALALTGGRTGYVTWGLLGFMFAALKWRRIIIIGPVALLVIVMLVPAAKDRLLTGFDDESADRPIGEFQQGELNYGGGNVDMYTVTSGRTSAWPYVIDELYKAPFWGHGKEAMIRTGISAFLYETYLEPFPHPHNMYLQWLLDNGIIGFIPVILFYLIMLRYSMKLLRDKRNGYFVAVGGVCLSLVMAMMIAGMGSQTFYPREGSVAMWGAIFLMLRVYLQQKALQNQTGPINDEELFATDIKKSHRRHG